MNRIISSIKDVTGANVLGGRSQRTLGIFRAVLSAAAVASLVFAVGCSNDGDDDGGGGNGNGGGDPAVIGSGGAKLVGDWTPVQYSDYQNERFFFSFKPNGDICAFEFQKVENFWVGVEECFAKWRADDKHLYYIDPDDEDHWDRDEYSVSANTLTITYCNECNNGQKSCNTDMYTKGGSKPSGTIRSGDPDLVWTDWRMSSGDNGGLYFSMSLFEFWGVDYFDYNNYDNRIWYTDGSKLYMLGLTETNCKTKTVTEVYCGETETYTYDYDCSVSIAEQVEFTYTHIPGATLRLRNSQLDIDDTWEYYDWRDYDNAPPLSKRRGETGRRSSLFRPLSRFAPLSGR